MIRSSKSMAAILLCGAFCGASSAARADDVADFYKSHKLTLIIAFPPGGGYDAYARLAGRYIGRHLPGNPVAVPQEMPMAGGLRAANYLYNVAARDGSVIGLVAHNVMEQQVLGAPDITYQAQNYNWIGRMNVINEAEVAWRASGVTGIEDAFKRQIVLGASGPTATPTVYPHVLNVIAGTKFKIVTGYSGAPEACLAMERGEVQGCLIDLGQVKTRKQKWLEQNSIVVLFQMNDKPDPVFPGVRTYASFGKTKQERQALSVFSVSSAVGRAIMAPPGIPAARIAALRAAFDAAVKDPGFIAEAAKEHLDLDTAPGVELQSIVRGAADLPPAVIARAKAALAAK